MFLQKNAAVLNFLFITKSWKKKIYQSFYKIVYQKKEAIFNIDKKCFLSTKSAY